MPLPVRMEGNHIRSTLYKKSGVALFKSSNIADRVGGYYLEGPILPIEGLNE